VAARPDELVESERIKHDIGRTREQMSGTIDEIQERLHPSRLLRDATVTVREAGVDSVKRVLGRAGEAAGRKAEKAKAASVAAAGYARTHPLPTALLIGGLAVVLVKALARRRRTSWMEDFDELPHGGQVTANDPRLRPEYQDWADPGNDTHSTAGAATSWMARNSLAVGAAVAAAGTVAGIRWANRPAQPPDAVRR
jgi:hypothetical protein